LSRAPIIVSLWGRWWNTGRRTFAVLRHHAFRPRGPTSLYGQCRV